MKKSMKKALKAAMKEATIWQNENFRKRLEFVKEKGLLMERIIEGWDQKNGLGKKRSQFILDCFKRSLMFFPTDTAKADSPAQLREWPGLPSLKAKVIQPMTQEKMEKLWNSIEERIETCDIDEDQYDFIDFEKGTWATGKLSTRSFLDAIIELEIIGTSTYNDGYVYPNLRVNSPLKGYIYLVDQWDKKGQPVYGLLKAVDEEGKSFFARLKHFSMIAYTTECNDNNDHTLDANQSKSEDDKVAATDTSGANLSQAGDDKVAATAKDAKGGAVSALKECTEAMNPNTFILFNHPLQVCWRNCF